MKRLLAGLLVALLAVAPVARGTAQEPAASATSTVTSTAPATPRAEITATATPSPSAMPTPSPEATLPVRTISQDFSMSATLREDSDADARTSPGDLPASNALAELQANVRWDGARHVKLSGDSPVVGLFTNADGSFSFVDVPPGEYLLWIWAYGFIEAPTAPTNPGLFLANVVVDKSGTVSGAVPAQFLLKPKPPGVLGYPVRTGSGADQPPAVGRLDVGEALANQRVAALPATGAGESRRGWLLPVLGIVLVASATAVAAALGVRRS